MNPGPIVIMPVIKNRKVLTEEQWYHIKMQDQDELDALRQGLGGS
jgi:hypothetical protein